MFFDDRYEIFDLYNRGVKVEEVKMLSEVNDPLLAESLTWGDCFRPGARSRLADCVAPGYVLFLAG